MRACLRVHIHRLIALVLTGVLALGLALVATPAHAVGTGQITGTVTGPGGAALPDISVGAFQLIMEPGNWGMRAQPVRTNTAGEYDLSHLEPGTYRLGIWDSSGAHVAEFWNDVASVKLAEDIVVGDATVSGKDAELALATRITGTVTGSTGAGLEQASVTAYRKSSDPTGGWDEVGSTSANAAGGYALVGLQPGTYRVGFSHLQGGHLPEYWDDARGVWSAKDVVVDVDTPAAGIDAELALPTHISGAVSGPDGVGLANVSVMAYEKMVMGPEEVWSSVSGPPVTTNASGEYVIPGLRAGAYRLSFSDWAGRHLTEYWDNAETMQAARDIVVAENAPAAGIDAELAHPSRITGTVTGPDGAGLPYVYVWAYQKEPGTDSWTRTAMAPWTNAAGEYDLGGLRAGTYRLGFFPEFGEHVPVYWNDAATVASATDIVVGEGALVTGKNAQFAVDATPIPTPTPTPTPAPPTTPPATPPTTTPPAPAPAPAPTTPAAPLPAPETNVAAQLNGILGDLVVKGKVKPGRTLKITGLAGFFRTTVSYKIAWYAGKKRIKKATKPKLKVTKALRRKLIHVKIKATADGVSKAVRIKVGKVK